MIDLLKELLRGEETPGREKLDSAVAANREAVRRLIAAAGAAVDVGGVVESFEQPQPREANDGR